MNADLQSRSTLRAWVLYMVSHPSYFYQATGWRMTDANVAMIATELFWGDVRLGRVPTPHSKKRNVIRGLGFIAMRLGVRKEAVMARMTEDEERGKWAKWKIPVWQENGVYMAYTKRLARWAKHERFGNYGYGKS